MNDNTLASPRKDPTDRVSYGPKYDKSLSTAQIAARIRADIKAAVVESKLPKAMYSVRIDGHSGVQGRISRVPFQVLNAARVFYTADHPHEVCFLPRYTDEAQHLLVTVAEMVNAYNYDGSDRARLFRFFASIEFSYEETAACREALLASRAS